MQTPVELSNPIYCDEEAARLHLEAIRWPNGPVCPSCGLPDKVKVLGGKTMGPGWYHCGQCREKFTIRVGAVYERSYIPLHKWLLAFRLMASSKKGISAHQLHRTLGIQYKSAWFMAHRIREAMRDTDPTPLGGKDKVVEADETFWGPGNYVFVSAKGWQQVQGYHSKMKVLALVERGGKARSVKVEELSSSALRNVMRAKVSAESHLMTDEAKYYKILGQEFASHQAVNHSEKEYARGTVSTNTVEGYFSIFKRGMTGVYQHCDEKHLHRYLAEFDFRYSNRIKLGVDDAERTTRAIKGAEGKRLTYRRPDKQTA